MGWNPHDGERGRLGSDPHRQQSHDHRLASLAAPRRPAVDDRGPDWDSGRLRGVQQRLTDAAPLRLYLLALVAALLGNLAIDAITQHSAVAAWIKAVPWRGPVIVHSGLKILPVAAMALTVTGLSRRDLFLVRGDLAAPGKIPFTNSTLPWTSLGVILILVFAVAVVALLVPALRTSPQLLGRVRPWLPVILLFSLINSFTEEFTFRTVLLARLQPAVGGEQALWMTSIRFGLGHWFGNPSGPLGVVGATALGLMLGKSMLETG